MLTCYILVKHFNFKLFFILISTVLIHSHGQNTLELNHPFLNTDGRTCPFIETLSFGSDIDIKCNNTYLIFKEFNDEKSNWIFAHSSPFCQKSEAFVNQCSITQLESKYLKVILKSANRNEYACAYCPINYRPIAPMIRVTQDEEVPRRLYRFNLTATGLNQSESFEILWAKRRSDVYGLSINFWFSKRCVARDIDVLQVTGHSIVFTVDDSAISRVEFIIRRCSGTCRTYRRCHEETFNAEISANNFQIPDSIEKVSCDHKCLNGIIPSTPSPSSTTMNNPVTESSKTNQTIKFIILFSLLGLLIVLSFIILGCFILLRIKGLRTDNIYTKTSNINLDENKEIVEE